DVCSSDLSSLGRRALRRLPLRRRRRGGSSAATSSVGSRAPSSQVSYRIAIFSPSYGTILLGLREAAAGEVVHGERGRVGRDLHHVRVLAALLGRQVEVAHAVL